MQKYRRPHAGFHARKARKLHKRKNPPSLKGPRRMGRPAGGSPADKGGGADLLLDHCEFLLMVSLRRLLPALLVAPPAPSRTFAQSYKRNNRTIMHGERAAV